MSRNNPSLTDYAVRLRWHDWGYRYSDDHNVYMRGMHDFQDLKRIADVEGGDFQALFVHAVDKFDN